MFSLDNFNICSLAYLCFGGTSLVVGATALAFSSNRTHKLWALFNGYVAWWGISLFLISLCKDVSAMRALWKLTVIGGMMIPAAFVDFCMEFLNEKRRHAVTIYYIAIIVICALFVFDHIHFNVYQIYESVYYIRSVDWTYSIILIGFIVPAIHGHIFLLKKIASAPPEMRVPIKYTLFGLSVGFASGSVTHFLTAYGFPIHPAWNLLIIVYVLLTTYAIFRHRLFALEDAVQKSIVYTMFLSIVTVSYFIGIFFLEAAFRQSLGYQSTSAVLIMFIVIILLAEPLRHLLQTAVDRYFFKSPLVSLAGQSEALRREMLKQDRLRSIATFAAGMAHEIKNPLTSIRTFAEYLPEKCDDQAFRERFSRIVVDEVDRVNNIIQQLLDFSKPRDLAREQVAIERLVEDTLGVLSGNILKNGVSLTKQYRVPRGFTIAADPVLLRQAILNILINSLQAMPKGGELRISMNVAANEYELSIKDSGVGIPKDKLSRVFDPFFTTKEDGTGLGLSIVNTAVSAHGGRVEVDSKEGIGTEVRIVLRT
jgi:signal transduction histidine kinase